MGPNIYVLSSLIPGPMRRDALLFTSWADEGAQLWDEVRMDSSYPLVSLLGPVDVGTAAWFLRLWDDK